MVSALLLALGLGVGFGAVTAQRAAAQPAPPADTTDYVSQVRSDFSPEDRLYARVRQGIALIEPLYEAAICLLLLWSGASTRLRDLAQRAFRRRYPRVLAYLAILSLAVFLLELPLEVFRGYWWEHRFGLSNQTAADWGWEAVKALALGVLISGGTGIVTFGLWVIERTGRRWWLWVGVVALPVLLATVVIQPLVIEPAFNRFTPLRDVELRGRILGLAARAGIPARRVVEVDRSRQTRKLNAYVSGFGPSQRIVLWDTTLQGLRDDEILAVVGHEIGHYKLAHIWKGVVLLWLVGFALLFAASRIMEWALRRFGSRWGVRTLHDEAVLPLFAATLGLLLFAAQPLGLAWGRRIEREADAYGLEITRDNDAAARAFVAMGRRNRSDPDPPRIVELLLYTHPPLVDRVRLALTYRPWEEGKPNRYFR